MPCMSTATMLPQGLGAAPRACPMAPTHCVACSGTQVLSCHQQGIEGGSAAAHMCRGVLNSE